MKTLVVYDSQFGSTEKIAQAIGAAIGKDVKVVKASGAGAADLNGIDLLIVGAPTQGGRMTKPVQDFLNGIPASALEKVNTAAFDTRVTTKLVVIFGYAAGRIAAAFKSKKNNPVVPAEGFFVKGSKGPLVDGEEARAAEWAKKVVKAAGG